MMCVFLQMTNYVDGNNPCKILNKVVKYKPRRKETVRSHLYEAQGSASRRVCVCG